MPCFSNIPSLILYPSFLLTAKDVQLIKHLIKQSNIECFFVSLFSLLGLCGLPDRCCAGSLKLANSFLYAHLSRRVPSMAIPWCWGGGGGKSCIVGSPGRETDFGKGLEEAFNFHLLERTAERSRLKKLKPH